MQTIRYVGMDVHTECSAVVVLNAQGKVVMESVLATQASPLLDFLTGLRGTVHVTFEEGTHAAWLYDVLRPHVAKVIGLCPRIPGTGRE